MAALRGEGDELELCDDEVPGRGRAVDSGAEPPEEESELSDRTTGMGTEGVFSKLRAWLCGLFWTTDLAASLLTCAPALSFFAPVDGAGVLVWGAREVIGAPAAKTLQLTVRSTCRNRFIEITGQAAYFADSAKSALTVANGDGKAPQFLDKVYGWFVPHR